MCVLLAGQYVDLDDFVEITKQYAQGIAPTPGLDATQKKSPSSQEDKTVRMDDHNSMIGNSTEFMPFMYVCVEICFLHCVWKLRCGSFALYLVNVDL